MSDVGCDIVFIGEDGPIQFGLVAEDSDVGGFRWEEILSAT